MKELTDGLYPDKFSIVLDHQPQDYSAQAAADIDLVLSGHTHGGQLFPLMTIENHSNLAADDRVYGYEKEKTPISLSHPESLTGPSNLKQDVNPNICLLKFREQTFKTKCVIISGTNLFCP